MKSVDVYQMWKRRQPKAPPKIPVVQYTLWSALNHGTGENAKMMTLCSSSSSSNTEKEDDSNTSNSDSTTTTTTTTTLVDIPQDLRRRIAAFALLFLSNDAKCMQVAQHREHVCAFLSQMKALEVPAQVVVVILDTEKADFDAVVAMLPRDTGCWVVPRTDADLEKDRSGGRIHILKSFREDLATREPILVTLDTAGRKVNANAWTDMRLDLEGLKEFPWRPTAQQMLVHLFRAERVDEAITTQPCVMFVRMFNNASDVADIEMLFRTCAAQYRDARGTLSADNKLLTFFVTRSKEEVPTARAPDECRNGHRLVQRGAHDPTRCNGCNKLSPQQYGCPAGCGFELCDACFSKGDELVLLHPDHLLLNLLHDEFGRTTPTGKCIIAWDYTSGAFMVCPEMRNGDEVLAFFQKFDNVRS